MKVYIAGPMRGYKDFNFPAFDAAADLLHAMGHTVFNPAARDREAHGEDVNKSEMGDLDDVVGTGFSLRDALHADTSWICREADAVYMLMGWSDSKGANAERSLAIALGLTIWYEDANDLVVGDLLDSQRHTTHDEVRTVSSTGGEKGVKLARFDLIPSEFLWALAEHFGIGAQKYDDDNWRRGYEWWKSYGAMQRHLHAWLMGEDIDEETGSNHLIAVAWHACVLFWFAAHHPEFDTRHKTA